MSSVLNGIFNRVSNLIHTVSTGEAAVTEQEPPRSPTSSRLQTGRHSATAVDLTADSPSHRSKRPVPTHADSRSDIVRPQKKVRLTDEQRLVPGRYPSAHGATPVPDPYIYRPSTSAFGFVPTTQPTVMPKPGAQHSFYPLGPKVYTNKGNPTARNPGTTTFNSFLEEVEEQSKAAPTIPPLPYARSIDNPYPSKRRKIDVNLIDDEDDKEDSRSSRRQSSPPAVHSSPIRSAHFHSSRASVGSGHDVGTRSTLQSQNEFVDVLKITKPRRKASRAPVRQQNGNHSTPIVLDDEPTQPTTARKLQLNRFSQGKPAQTLSSGSTCGVPEQPAHKLLDSENLRDTFKRTVVERITDDEDELAPKTDTNKQRKKTTAARSKAKAVPQRWPLRIARIPGYDWSSLSPSLLVDHTERVWTIVAEDDDGKDVVLHEITSKRVNTAYGDDTRIHLDGPQGFADPNKYVCDLQFIDKAHLRDFKAIIANITIDEKVGERKPPWMDDLYGLYKPVNVSSEPDTGPRISQAQAANGERKPQRPQSINVTDSGKGSVRKSTRPTRSTQASQPRYIDVEENSPKPKPSKKHDLGLPWKRQLTYGSGRRRAVIDFGDLTRLEEEEYLNDQLIDFYMIHLFNHYNVTDDRVYFFNCHFFSTLTRNRGPINYAGVARWTAKEDLFNYDYIVVPICQDFHWFLAIICNVRNIARKPVMETAGGSPSPQPKTANKSTSSHIVPEAEISSEATHVTDGEGANVAPMPHPNIDQMPTDEGDEVSLLDTIDPDAVPNQSDQIPTVVEDVDAKQSSLAKAAPGDGVTAAASKKPKRRPPPKKVDPEEPVIIVLDSLGGVPKTAAVRALKDYIQAEGHEKRGMEAIIKQNAYYVKDNQIPMQQNLSDCGVFLLGYVEKFFQGPDEFKNRILQGEMQAEEDWPLMSISRMRGAMRDLLQDLQKKQEAELRRTIAEKNGIKSGALVPTNQANGTSTKNGVTPAEPISNTVKQTAVVGSVLLASEPPVAKEPSAVKESPTIKELAAPVETVAKTQQTAVNGLKDSNTRLGSPFESQPKKSLNSPSASPGHRKQIEVVHSPEPARNHAVAGPKPRQPSPPNRMPVRRMSPKVVIVSPAADKSKRRPEDSSPPSGFGRNLLGPKKQKMNGTHEQQESTEGSLDSGDEVTVVSENKVEKRKYRKQANRERSAAPVGRSPRSRREDTTAHGTADNTVISPSQQRSLARQAKSTVPKELEGRTKSKSSKFAEEAKPRPFSVTEMTVESPNKAAKETSSTKEVSTRTRGSSADPIQIDDSQEAIVASSTKTPKHQPAAQSEDTCMIESPKQLSKQAMDAFPAPFGTKNRSMSPAPPRRVNEEQPFAIYGALDAHLDAEIESTTGEEEEWNGFSDPYVSERDVDQGEHIIPESPPDRTRSPPSNEMYGEP